MTNTTTKSSFLATPKSDILCNTEVQHGSLQFLQSEISAFFVTNNFCCKNVEISDCKNGGLWCCTSMLHKMFDFGVARKLDFVVALVVSHCCREFSIKHNYKNRHRLWGKISLLSCTSLTVFFFVLPTRFSWFFQ